MCVYVGVCVSVYVCVFVCVCVCVYLYVWFYNCNLVGYREQYSTIYGFIPSDLWGTENKRILVEYTEEQDRTKEYPTDQCICNCV